MLMCGRHSTRVGEHHDLCREHAAGDHLETIRRGETATNVWWEVVEKKSMPISGAECRLIETNRRLRVDLDGELASRGRRRGSRCASPGPALFNHFDGYRLFGAPPQGQMKPVDDQPRVGNRLRIPRMPW